MDSDTTALIDQLRDKMAGMPHWKRIELIEKLGDGYFDFRVNYKPMQAHHLTITPIGELIQ